MRQTKRVLGVLAYSLPVLIPISFLAWFCWSRGGWIPRILGFMFGFGAYQVTARMILDIAAPFFADDPTPICQSDVDAFTHALGVDTSPSQQEEIAELPLPLPSNPTPEPNSPQASRPPSSEAPIPQQTTPNPERVAILLKLAGTQKPSTDPLDSWPQADHTGRIRDEGSNMFHKNENSAKANLLAERLVSGAISVAAVIVDEVKRSRVCDSLEFRTEDDAVQYLIEIVVFYMHLVDRAAFAILGEDKRDVFGDLFDTTVLTLLQKHRGDTSPNFEKALRASYNYRQTFYSQFKSLFPEGNGQLKGTLCWEFSKILFELFTDTNPVTLFEIAGIAGQMTGVMLYAVLKTDDVLRNSSLLSSEDRIQAAVSRNLARRAQRQSPSSTYEQDEQHLPDPLSSGPQAEHIQQAQPQAQSSLSQERFGWLYDEIALDSPNTKAVPLENIEGFELASDTYQIIGSSLLAQEDYREEAAALFAECGKIFARGERPDPELQEHEAQMVVYAYDVLAEYVRRSGDNVAIHAEFQAYIISLQERYQFTFPEDF